MGRPSFRTGKRLSKLAISSLRELVRCLPAKCVRAMGDADQRMMADTTSTTLTFLFWELSRNPAWQNRLGEELSGIGTITLQEVQDLPILDAIINEALRLHPAAPASLPRETPRGGKEMNGYFIPAEVRPRHLSFDPTEPDKSPQDGGLDAVLYHTP